MEKRTTVINETYILYLIAPKTMTTVKPINCVQIYVVVLSVDIRARAAVVDCSNTTYKEFIVLVLDSIANRAETVGAEQIDVVADFYHPSL